MARNISINNISATYNILITHTIYGIVYASCFGYSDATKKIMKDVNKKSSIFANYHSYTTIPNGYDIHSSKVPDSDFSHTIFYRKDNMYKSNSEDNILAFIFIWTDKEYYSPYSIMTSENEELVKILYDKIYDKFVKMCPCPMLREWIPYITRQMEEANILRMCNTSMSEREDKKWLQCLILDVPITWIINRISLGLKNNDIDIDGCNSASSVMNDIEGLDSYLNTYTHILTDRIQQSFIPRFIPTKDKYSESLNNITDYMDYMGNLALYPAQKAVAQAAANALDNKKSVFVIGECGVGKTALAQTIVMTHNRDKKALTNIVLCPGHLVEKWKYEIKRLMPITDTVIVDNFENFLKLLPTIKDKTRKRHLWLIISKEVAKFGYDERPAAIWRKGRHIHSSYYCCPECGKPLFYEYYTGTGRRREQHTHFLNENDFTKKTAHNQVCTNLVPYWNKKNMQWENRVCNAKLWEPVIRVKEDDIYHGNKWIKFGHNVGWYEENRAAEILEELRTATEIKKEDVDKLDEFSRYFNDEYLQQRAPRKYPIAKYIRRFLKGNIDYFVADEIHTLKGDNSLQGEAFGDLAYTAKKTIGLTGTLLNGYASGVYYILYRAFPDLMKHEGYEYGINGENKFVNDYGVIKKSYNAEWDNGRKGNRSGKTKVKALPGISPLVFTKFLLENATFIGIDDISSGLPGYKEVPVPIMMDEELKFAYTELEKKAHDIFSHRYEKGNIKATSQIINLLSIFPDQPYEQPTVINPETGEVLLKPIELEKRTRNKEYKLLEILQDKKAAGEKCLVYYQWTNRTDVGKRLPEFLANNGFKCAVLTSSVKSRDREQWIRDKVEKDNIDVLLCNPTLVETGLDLLEFRTIVFYQIGYNLYTMRQASRRSWRLSQDKDVEVYFLYYKDTVQEQALSLMATKLKAAMSIEGKFTEEGLNAMSNNEDVLTQIAASVTDGIKQSVDIQVFEKTSTIKIETEAEKHIKLKDVERDDYTWSLYDHTSKGISRRFLPTIINSSIKSILNSPILALNVT